MALVGRDPDRLAKVAEFCSKRGALAETMAIDVSDGATLSDRLRDFDRQAAVDLVVANAGVLTGPPAEDALDGLEQAAAQIRINLLGVVNTVEALAPMMVARRSGQIAVVSSTAALRGLPYIPAYSASKAGVRAYGEALRARLEPFGVKVSVVVPSFFESAMTDRFDGPTPMIMSAEAAAQRVRRGLDKGAARIVFPRRIGLLMQLLDLLPARLGDRLLRSNVRIRPASDGDGQ